MPERRKPRPISPEEREEIWRLANEGVAYGVIAERFDRPKGTISFEVSNGILAGKVVRRYQRLEDRRA
jgi:IS30 family transposase